MFDKYSTQYFQAKRTSTPHIQWETPDVTLGSQVSIDYSELNGTHIMSDLEPSKFCLLIQTMVIVLMHTVPSYIQTISTKPILPCAVGAVT